MKASKQNRKQEGAKPNNHLVRKPTVQKKEDDSSNSNGKISILGRKVLFGSKGVQAKLKVGSPNDSFEKEADSVADKVVNQSKGNHNDMGQNPITSGITNIQKKEAPTPNQNSDVSAVESSLNAAKGNGQKLKGTTKEEMESGFGVDFSNVNIHTGTKAEEINDKMGAQAITSGSDIYFNRGKYSPETRSGKSLLAHELTHTIQQTGMVHKKEEESTKNPIPEEEIVNPRI